MGYKNQIISVVVPVYNEIGNVIDFHTTLTQALARTRQPFEVIYVDDNSTDGTYEWLKRVQRYATKTLGSRHNSGFKMPHTVKVLRKQGLQGKAYSLLEGFAEAKGSIFVMIDGDMQYPPQAIPEMINELTKQNADIIVAKRKDYKDNALRRTLSTGFQKLFGKVLFGLTTDIQSGLKVFKSEVYKTVAFEPTSPWTFDLEFLHRSKQAGFVIKDFNITFSERLSGSSKVHVIKTVSEIGLNALAVRFKKLNHFAIPAPDAGMQGAGMGYKQKKYITHTTLPFSMSAAQTFSVSQRLFIWAVVGLMIVGLIRRPLMTLQLMVASLSILYFLDTVFNFFIVIRSLGRRDEIRVEDQELKRIDEKKLPIYTILCPLYKEAHVVPQFVNAISKLDWPKEKLDVMLLLEEDDVETIETIGQMDLPAYVRTVIVPDSMPKTKPKACNYGLALARGEYLVIYDAEDIPDPLQLKKAYLGFAKVPANVQCLQAKLNFYNVRQNWLTRFFTAEYSLWFDLTLTGLQSFRSTLPLGGTSNHFRTDNLKLLQGWDPFNVTEDADLGIRLFQKGYRTEILDSTTMEEATSKTKTWIKQRSRWIKGYMQTYLVHMRDISGFVNEKGLMHMFIFQLTVGGKILFVLINPLMWITTLTYFTLYVHTAPFIEAVFAPPLSYFAVCSLVFGNFMFLYSYMIGIGKRKQWDLMKYVFFIPYYWALMSIAASYGLFQLIFKPHYWEKTTHGMHLPGAAARLAVAKKLKSEARNPKEILNPDDQKTKRFKNSVSGNFGFVSSFEFRTSIFKKKPSLLASVIGVLLIQIPIAAYFNTDLNGLLKALLFLGTIDFIVLMVLYFRREYIASIVNNVRSVASLFDRPTKSQAWKEKRLNILVFNWRDTKHIYGGGAEVYIQQVAKRWVKDGNKVTLFCGNDNHNLPFETVNGVEIIRRGGTYTVYLFAAIYYLLRLRGKYDVIIDCENGIPFFTPLYTRKPVILLIHHVHQEVFRDFLQFPLKQIAKLLEGQLMPALYWNKHVVTVSESSKKEIKKLGIIRPGNIDVVHNGVEEAKIEGIKKTVYPSFSYLGRLKAYKNVDVAILAFAQVVKEFPTAKLFIAGDGEMYPELQKIVAAFNLTENVKFLGRVSEAQKTKLLAQSWVMLQPSQMEGWGISVIEANAHGTPVIASKVNGLSDSVRANETGLLVQAGDVQGFANAMKRLIKDTDFRLQLGRAAYAWSYNFRWDMSAELFYMIIGRSIHKKQFAAISGSLALGNNYEK
jgi:cellulose synthase/poly-beta-1,6-N-acetylglucosamine synthase-like glycosyltransferase/glycosyltransferase involved in cell wall biosynthesis